MTAGRNDLGLPQCTDDGACYYLKLPKPTETDVKASELCSYLIAIIRPGPPPNSVLNGSVVLWVLVVHQPSDALQSISLGF